MNIPIMRPHLGLGPGLIPYLEEIGKTGVYSNFGPQVVAFTAEVADLLGVLPSQVVTVSNATAALEGALTVLGPDEWLVPSWTFVASLHAVLGAKKVAVFGDVDARSNVLSPSGLRAGQSAMITAPFGAHIEIGEEWNHAAAVVVDAAAALGSAPTILPSFHKPWAIVYSLHATKILGIGEGAIAVFSDPAIAAEFKAWTNFGFAGSRISRAPATNAKMSEMHAAIGRLQLKNWARDRAEWVEARRRAHHVGEELAVNMSFSSPSWVSPYWIVQFDSGTEKEEATSALHRADIATRDWWEKGCHQMPAFRHFRQHGDLRNTLRLGATTVGLPFFRDISEAQIERIREVISATLGRG